MGIRKGQHTIEFAVLIAVVVAALVAGGIYIRRSIQAKLKLVELQINNPPSATAISDIDINPAGCSYGENYISLEYLWLVKSAGPGLYKSAIKQADKIDSCLWVNTGSSCIINQGSVPGCRQLWGTWSFGGFSGKCAWLFIRDSKGRVKAFGFFPNASTDCAYDNARKESGW
jgi:hypothetical protein